MRPIRSHSLALANFGTRCFLGGKLLLLSLLASGEENPTLLLVERWVYLLIWRVVFEESER